MDQFSAKATDTELRAYRAPPDEPQGIVVLIDDEQDEKRNAIGLDDTEARELAAWILAAVPPVDHSPGRYCAICRHSGGEGPYLWCNHPVATHIDPILGKPVGQTASYMRACARPCGPAGKLFEPIEPPAPAAD